MAKEKSAYGLLLLLCIVGVIIVTSAFLVLDTDDTLSPSKSQATESTNQEDAPGPIKKTPFTAHGEETDTVQSTDPVASSGGGGGSGGSESPTSSTPQGPTEHPIPHCILARPGNTAPLECSVQSITDSNIELTITNSEDEDVTVDVYLQYCDVIQTKNILAQSMDNYNIPCTITESEFESDIIIGYTNGQFERIEIYGIITGLVS